jgi:hypothetical protein
LSSAVEHGELEFLQINTSWFLNCIIDNKITHDPFDWVWAILFWQVRIELLSGKRLGWWDKEVALALHTVHI